jgi:hypothetical protein
MWNRTRVSDIAGSLSVSDGKRGIDMSGVNNVVAIENVPVFTAGIIFDKNKMVGIDLVNSIAHLLGQSKPGQRSIGLRRCRFVQEIIPGNNRFVFVAASHVNPEIKYFLLKCRVVPVRALISVSLVAVIGEREKQKHKPKVILPGPGNMLIQDLKKIIAIVFVPVKTHPPTHMISAHR